jgi:hypothetical protein
MYGCFYIPRVYPSPPAGGEGIPRLVLANTLIEDFVNAVKGIQEAYHPTYSFLLTLLLV